MTQLRQQQLLWHSDYDTRVERLGEQVNVMGIQLREELREKAVLRDVMQLQE